MKLGIRTFLVRKDENATYGWQVTMDLDKLGLSESDIADFAARAIVVSEQSRLRGLSEEELDRIGTRVPIQKGKGRGRKIPADVYIKASNPQASNSNPQ